MLLSLVPVVGLEPTCLAAVDFESTGSTNFPTPAQTKIIQIVKDAYLLQKRYSLTFP